MPGRFNGLNPLRLGAPLQVSLTLPSSTDARILVLDAAGRECAALPRTTMHSGSNLLQIPAGDLKPGILWLQARNDSGATLASRRFVVLQ